jgi:hypothetical protein
MEMKKKCVLDYNIQKKISLESDKIKTLRLRERLAFMVL